MSAQTRLLLADLAQLDRDAPGFDTAFAALQEQARGIIDAARTPRADIASYAAGTPDGIAAGEYTHGPERSAWRLGALPDDHVLVGLGVDGEVLTRGLVLDGRVDWNALVTRERRDAADALFENADFGTDPDGVPWSVLDSDGWDWNGSQTVRRNVYVERTEQDGSPSERKTLAITFADGSAEVVEATFGGEDVAERTPDETSPEL